MVELEGVPLPEKDKLVKADYIEAIISHQHREDEATLSYDKEAEDEAGEDVEETKSDIDSDIEQVVPPVAHPTVDDAEMIVEKKFIAVNNITELKAIVAKEGIEMERGRKTKTDYVNAIYLARKRVALMKCD